MKTLQKLTFMLFATLLFISCDKDDDDSQGSSSCNGATCEYTIASGETAGTVPSTLDGTYTLTYHDAQSGSPFTDGVTGVFTISNNKLTVEIDGEECITLSNPVLIGTNNYKFKDDCRDDIAYNVSPNNNGEFNEINIEPLEQGWLGQFSVI